MFSPVSIAGFRNPSYQGAVSLEGQANIEMLDEALEDFYERFSHDDEDDDGRGMEAQMHDIIQVLEGLPSLRELPGDILTSMLDMLPAGLFSKELQDKVKAEAKRRGCRYPLDLDANSHRVKANY